MFEQLDRPGLLGKVPDPLKRAWVIAVILFNLLLVALALYFEQQELYSEAGITAAIALFIITYSTVVYAVIWWMKQV